MNILINPAIIARLEAEICPTHGKSAVIFADKDVLSIREACINRSNLHRSRSLPLGSNSECNIYP